MLHFDIEFGVQFRYFKGGGGGGGGAGVVDYPAHMKTFHENALGDGAVGIDVTDAMTAALGSSPWAGGTAYNPDTAITAYEAAITDFSTILAGINEVIEWAALFTQAAASIVVADEAIIDITVVDEVVADRVVADKAITGITDAEIVVDSAAYGASLDNQIIATVLPRFQGGMRDINAVVSSAFVIGEALIDGSRDTDVAKHESGLRVEAAKVNTSVDVEEAKMNIEKDVNISTANLSKDVSVSTINLDKEVSVATANLGKDVKIATANLAKDVNIAQIQTSATGQMTNFLIQKYAWEEAYMRVVIEGKRIKIVAKGEESATDLKIGESDALWDLGVFSYGGNLLASIGGGVMNPNKPSTTQSMLGGALSGAAAGAMVGGPWGAAIGGVLGAASGLL